MPINYDEILTRRSEPRPFSYNDTQTLLYNLSVGMGRDPLDEKELPFVFEQPALRVVPTAVTVLGAGSGFGTGDNPMRGLDLNWTLVLHGEQRVRLHRPLPPAAEVVGSSHIAEAVDKGEKGAIITLATEVQLTTGEPLFTSESVIFARGDGGFGGPAKSKVEPHVMPDRAPDLVHVTVTRPDQALIYRLNGDRNPLHAEPAFAKRAGFPAPILHGLCSYGIACRALVVTVCDYDPTRIAAFDARMTSPVFPGETIETDIWQDGGVASFRCRIPARGVTSLNNGRCVLRS